MAGGIRNRGGKKVLKKLFYRDLKPEKNLPAATLLLMHGAGGSHLSWRYQLEQLSDTFRIIAVDLPGHGQSEESAEATIRGHAEPVLELMTSLQLEKVVLGGHSMGGAIALDLALKGSDRIGGLVLVGTGVKLRVLPAIFSMIRSDFNVAIEGMAQFMFGSDPPVELVNEEKQLLARNSADVVLKDFTACDSFDVMDEIDSLSLPTLIICGNDDRLTPPRYSEFLHRKIPGSKLVLLEECGHMPMLERAAEFNRHVSSFLMELK